jgi:hypothetical protein
MQITGGCRQSTRRQQLPPSASQLNKNTNVILNVSDGSIFLAVNLDGVD